MALLNFTTFGQWLIFDAVVLTAVLSVVLFFARKKDSEAYLLARFGRPVELALIVAATLIPIAAFYPNGELSRPLAFFVLEGVTAGLSAVYVAIAPKRWVLFYVLLIAYLSIPASVYARNLMYPTYNFRSEPLYSTGTISTYEQGAISGGFYYFIPIDTLNLVAIGSISGITNWLVPLYQSAGLLVTLLCLWVFFDRLGLRAAFPALFLLLSIPELSFLTGRAFAFPMAALVLALTAFMASRRNIGGVRQGVLLIAITSLTLTFTHPLGPLFLTIFFAMLYLLLARKRDSPLPAPVLSGL